VDLGQQTTDPVRHAGDLRGKTIIETHDDFEVAKCVVVKPDST
jgi:hypothetical protein